MSDDSDGIDWGDVALDIGKSVLPPGVGAIIGGLFNRGSSKAQNKAMNEMLKIAKMQADIQKRQADMDLPYRSNLFNALQNRAKRRQPRFMQGSFTATNPYRNVRRVAPPQSFGAGNSQKLNSTLLNALANRKQAPRGAGNMASPDKNPFVNPIRTNFSSNTGT
jgi:hypothetical protein